MSETANALEQAMNLHRAGRVDEAKQLYESIPDSAPEYPDAIHLRGVIAIQQGRPGDAVTLIRQAIHARDNVPAMHSNLGEAYRAMGRRDEAIGSYRRALELQPDYHACRANLALALTEQGKLEDGEKELRQVLDSEPNNALAWNNLGNNLRMQKRIEEALGALRKAVRLEPNNPEALSNLGQMLLEDNEREEAAQYCANAVKLAPSLPAARNNYGNALREMQRLDEAEEQYQAALRLQPNLAITHNNMGQLNQQKGEFDEALRWYQQSLKLEPRSPRALSNLASALFELDRHEDAEKLYRAALEIDPQWPEAHLGLGHLLKRQDDPAGAVGEYREALRIKPSLGGARLGLATVYSEQGNFDEAEKEARRVLEEEPRAVGAYERLVGMQKKKLPDSDVKAMHELLDAKPPLQEGAVGTLRFALATWADSAGKYDEAAEHLEKANLAQWESNQRRGRKYDADEHTQFVDNLTRVFTKERFETAAGWGDDSEVPVFVLGLPRSGTTLAEQVLASHERVFGADELRFARESFHALPGALGKDINRIEAIEQLTEDAVKQVAAEHLEKLKAKSPESDRIVDKMPENYLNMGVIRMLFPKARIIHMRRDLRDTAISSWITHFGQIRWANRKEDILSHYRNYWRVMDYWREVMGDAFIEVNYSDMVEDLETQARRMLDFCGLDWDAGVLEFHKTERPVKTASVAQVRQPLYTKSLARWKRYEDHLGEWLEQLDAIQQG